MTISWKEALAEQKQAAYFKQVMAFVASERAAGKTIYPPQDSIFNALKYTPLADVKVVILGQDPYHGPDQAHGLCFSVLKGVRPPPSLQNMFKELTTDFEGFVIPNHGELTAWAEQGVLLLNTVLTVEQGRAHSHAKKGWETFTDAVISAVNQHCENVVFMLWGSHAQKKAALLDTAKHSVLKAPHPSPLSAYRGFFGCRHFSLANQIISENGAKPIDWRLTD